ncbi:MAG: DUF4912 domain-containing protein [Treponema sp.]|nr:DUF4912 domain-containing protein [Treponema sp.]
MAVSKQRLPVSRQKLESLSTDELIKLADDNGIDIPFALERIFIIEELLELSNTEKKAESEDLEPSQAYPETAALPKQYNISFIDVIIRDPLWVFAFWEVKSHDREVHENAAGFIGYCLRVIPLNEEGKESPDDNSFTVPVEIEDCARYLGLAEHSSLDWKSPAAGCYIVKLEAMRGKSLMPIASSKPFYLPKLNENTTFTSLNKNPLIHLSGVQDLTIIKNTDRQSRVKRQ